MSMLLNSWLFAAAVSGYNDIKLVGYQICPVTTFALGSVAYSLTGGDSGYAASAPATDDHVVVLAAGAAASTTSRGLILKGFESVSDFRDDTADANGILGIKRMGVIPDTTLYYTATSASSTQLYILILVFRYVDPYNPLDVAMQATGGTNGLQGTPPSITPVTPGALIIEAMNGAIGAAVDGTYTIPGTLTDSLQSHGTTGTGICYSSVALGLKRLWTSGAWVPSAWSHTRGTNSLDSWNGFTMALRPSGAAAPVSAYVVGRGGGATGTTNTTSHPVSLPGTYAIGDLLLLLWTPNCSSGISISSLTNAGWKQFGNLVQSSTHASFLLWKVADGTDAVTITSSVSTQSSHITVAIQAWDSTRNTVGNEPFVVQSTNHGTSNLADPTPPAVNPGVVKNWLCLVAASWDGSGGPITPFSCPAKYSNLWSKSGTGSNNASCAVADRVAANVSSETPGSWWSSGEQVLTWTLMVYPE